MKGFLVFAAACLAVAASASPLSEAKKATAEERRKACQIARQVVTRAAEGKPFTVPQGKPTGVFARQLPCFVTIAHKERRRGCTGNFSPQGKDFAANIAQTALRGYNLDPRTKRLTPDQLKTSRIYVSIPDTPRPVSDLSRYSPANYGVVVESGTRRAVLLPGEAKTSSWSIKEAKRQAGIPTDAPVRIQVFQAVTFAE